MKGILIISTFLISLYGTSQQRHLEVGARFGFKDEFHITPSFDLNSRYTEIHSFDLSVFGRVSRRRFGTEFGFGFEKASDFFVRYTDNSTQFDYVRLHRVSIDLSQYYYLYKSALHKWDVQFGLRNYFGFNERIWIPQEMDLNTWKLSGRLSTNYTYKSFMVGLFYEYDFRSDYVYLTAAGSTINDHPVVFGFNVGVIY